MKRFKVYIQNIVGFCHGESNGYYEKEHVVEARNEKVAMKFLVDAEIIRPSNYVRITEMESK